MKKRQITKQNKDIVLKNDSRKRTRDFMLSNGLYNPDKIIDTFAKDMDKNNGKELSPKLCEDYQKVAMTLGLDTHLPVADSLIEEYRPFLINTIREIEREYDCKTTIEKTLAESIASSYVRIIHYSKRLNEYILRETVADKEKTDFYNFIGKELDRAHRQHSSSIMTLRQIKAPTLPFNVSAKTAFFAQNQQINNYDNQDEINERQ